MTKTRFRVATFASGLALLVFCAPVARASVIDLGLLSFDVLLPPADGSPGVNIFDIVNFTGDPAASGFALPPDFPVLTFVTLQEATLLFNGTGASITLPDIAPGQLDSGSAPQFSGDALFTSALFTATLSETTFLLDGGGIFTADPTLSAMLLPSSGPNLIAGTDIVVLQATGTLSGSETPEPGSAALIAVSIVAALGARRAFMRLRY